MADQASQVWLHYLPLYTAQGIGVMYNMQPKYINITRLLRLHS